MFTEDDALRTFCSGMYETLQQAWYHEKTADISNEGLTNQDNNLVIFKCQVHQLNSISTY